MNPIQQTASIRLTFLTNLNNKINLSVRRSRINATSPIVDSAMDEIIRTNVYDTGGRGYLQKKVAARLIITDSINFNVSEYTE